MGSIRHNLAYKLLALALSVALWADVKLHQEPLTLPIPVRLETRNVPEGYVATTAVTQTTAVVYGPKVYATRVPSASLHAYVDLHNTATPALRKEDVKVVLPPRLQAVVSIDSVAPDKVDVRIRRMTSRTVPVVVNWTGKSIAGARYDVSSLRPVTVIASGPDEAVNDVDHAVVNLPSGAQRLSDSYPVSAVDKNGDVVNEIQIKPDTVWVEATLQQTEGTQQAFVSPAYVGVPAKSFRLERVVSEPQVVMLVGPPDRLRDITSIRTRPISIANSKSDVSRSVEVAVPSGVVAQPSTVLVRFHIAAAR